jgi:5-methylcytosine-specific restriction endonuclease McrA
MKKIVSGKTPRLRLDSASYAELHQQVLERDRWRCQSCGSMRNLQVHHKVFRSQSGSDEEHNLITLCAECHARLHR